LANSLGIVCVAAAGNDHVDTPMYPASYDHVISVAATDSNNQLAYFSNYGNTIDIAAPGVDIISCIADNNNAYGLKSGTSMACPYVSSVCALMLCQNPALSPDEVLSCIQNSATDISTLNPAYIGQMGAGLIDVAGIFECLLVPPIADFLFYDAVYCPNQPIQFTSQSAGYQITNWQWTFEGGTPATSTLQNPTVSFTTLGSHTVTLTVTNVYGSNTNTQTVMVGSASAILSGGDGSLLTPGTNVSLIINYNGLLPYNCVYTDGTNNYTLSNINQTPYTFVITATTDATYTLVNVNSNCPVSISGQAIIDVFQAGNNSDLCECVLNRSIINKGFEQPIVPPGGLAFFEAANGPNPTVPGWQCTDALFYSGITYPIEFWAYGFNGVFAIEGNQFVEINAVNFNRLYQNVCLINGEQISWHYYHRGRAGVDVMQFRLYDTNNNLVQVLDTASTGLAWQAYDGSAIFTGTTGLYQLSFEAISTATGSPAIGNFVDDVQISLSPIISFTNNISSDIEIIGGNLPILIINGVVPTPGITVFISVIEGTATNSIDYTLPTSVFIPAGTYDGTANTAITIPILVIDDNLIEANETIIIEVSDIQPEQFQLSEVCWESNILYTIIDDDIAPNPCIINATITGNSTICIGQTTALTASGGISYQWSTGSNVATIVADIAGDYTVTVSDAGGCTDTATFNVWIAPQPVVLPLQIDTSICPNATLIMPISNLTPISDYSYAWFPIIGLSCTDCPNPILTTNQSATYTLTITNSYGCSNTQTFTVNVNNNNVSTNSLTQTSCNPADVGTVTNTFVAANGCDSTVTVITTLLPSSTNSLTQTSCNPADVGTVTNTFVAANGCDSTVTVITTLLPSSTNSLTQTSCNPADVGTVTNTFVAANGCDSTVTVITTLLPSSTNTLTQTSCNPADVGTVTNTFVAANGCDSTVTVITTLLPSSTNSLTQTSCNPPMLAR
jgi:PKD repeat protein